MGLFGNIDSAKVNKSGSYFRAIEKGQNPKEWGRARYLLEIVECKAQTSNQANKVFAIIECRVKKTNHPEIAVGEVLSQVIDMSNVMAGPNIRKFVAAALGIDPYGEHAMVTREIERLGSEALGRTANVEMVCEWLFSKENPLKGEEVALECGGTVSKKGTAVTTHDWHPCADFSI